MTPIVSISGGDLPSASVLGVDLQPSGLRLYEFADLSIVPPQLSPTADIAGFTYEGDGDDLHRYPATLDAGRILLHVIHFSGAGANICVELCPPPIDPPPQAITESQLEQLIASLDPHDPFYATRLAELLHGYYQYFIAPDLTRMQQDCEFATGRIPKVLAWSRTNQILLNEEGFEAENQTIGNALVGSVSNCWSEATATCLDVKQYLPDPASWCRSHDRPSSWAAIPRCSTSSKVRRCSGLWSGTITFELRYDEDGDFLYGSARTRRAAPADHDAGMADQAARHRRTSLRTMPIPDIRGDVERLCIKRRSLRLKDTAAARIRVPIRARSMVATSRRRSPSTSRATSARLLSIAWSSQGDPPLVMDVHVSSTSSAAGTRRTGLPGLIHVVEDWNYWPFSGTGPGIPLDRTDPTIPWTSDGAARRPAASRPVGVGGGLIVITTTWTWKLTLEPDTGQ